MIDGAVFVMRFNRPTAFAYVIAWYCAIAVGCSPKLGYIINTEQMCKALASSDNNGEISRWAAEQMLAHRREVFDSPYHITITNTPPWVRKVIDAPPEITVNYYQDHSKDNVMVVWASGRGISAIQIGGTNFVCVVNEELFYSMKCKPGIYAWHSRRDY